MNTERLYIADAFNDDNIRLFQEFEERNDINNKTTSVLNYIRDNYTKEMYENLEKSKNEISQTLYTMQDGYIKDMCHIRGEKDRKICELFFAPLKNEPKNRSLLSSASNYVFNILGMEEIFVSIDESNKGLRNTLEQKGFENLGEVNKKTTYLKEKEDIKEMKRVI